MGRPNAAKLIEAIPGSGGIITTIAKRAGCEWHTAKKYIEQLPSVKQAYQSECETIGDLCESVLVRNIQIASKLQGEKQEPVETADAKWLLARRFKSRGYSEEQQIDVTTNGESLADVVRRLASESGSGGGSPATD